jgi:hypothetical protein
MVCDMKRFFLFISIMLGMSLLMGFSSAKVVTEDDGRQIVIFPDGTWKEFRGDIRPTISEQQLILGGDESYGVWYNSSSWEIPEKFESDVYDIEFTHITKGAYGYVLYSKERIPEAKLREYALHNARQVVDELDIKIEEKVDINNAKVLCLQMEGWYSPLPNIQMIYCGYYYTGAHGSIQFVTYTTVDVFPAIQQDIKSLLNGFVLIPK